MGNTYLEGNYAPVQCEHTITELAATGTIPAHLDGRYLRNGPNPVGALDPETYHWFTGDGMVHGVRLREGTAQWYRNRWIVDLADGKIRETCFDDHPQEFPRIDDRLTGRPHRYGYS